MNSEKTVIPSKISMLFCDDAFHIMEGNKVCLIGIFSSIFASSFPAGHPKIAIYQRFTDCVTQSGKGRFEFRYLDGNRELFFQAEGPLEFMTGDRNKIQELVFHIRNIIFPRAGKIEVTFFLNDKVVNQAKIDMIHLSDNK